MRELALVGGGHAHAEVLRRFALDPPRDVRLTVVLERLLSIYSGMVPGLLAGQYRVQDAEIDVAALARRAGAQVVLAPLLRIDARARRLVLGGGAALPYDVASLNLGSSPAGLDLPGVAAQALPVRPIGTFVRRLLERLAGAAPGLLLVVVGAGPGGVELAFALRRRMPDWRVSLVEAGPRLIPRAPASLARRVLRRTVASGLDVRCASRVTGADPGTLLLGDGSRIGFDALVWVAGARGVPVLTASDLPRDARGFVRTEATLQVESHPELFAAGDCASLRGSSDLPKAGVYAVRQGPVLARNLRNFLEGIPLRRYRPQSDFLTLLNMADGTAVGSKWGVSFEGRWVMRLKDRIDRRFVARYRAAGC